MYLTHLSLTNFRSFTRLDLDLPRRVVLLVGDNAQGKTSLLEAIYFLAEFTSFHASNDRQAINLLALSQSPAVSRLVADFQRAGKAHHLEIRLILETGSSGFSRLRKEILLDGVKRAAGDAIGLFNAVIFLPQMSAIIEDGPDERRRYLNMTLSQVIPGFATALSEYANGVSQRNALLKQLAEHGGNRDQLDFWDELISRRGAQLIAARIKAVLELEKQASEIHQKLTRTTEVLRMIYEPAYDPCLKPENQLSLALDAKVDRSQIPTEEIQRGFMQRLKEIRGEEIARGVTTIGPHRDELRFLINQRDLSDFGSRGQIRTVLLALKLAEMQWMHEKTGQFPVLLLDEIMAELDHRRREDLLSALSDCEQSFLTTTDVKLFEPAFVDTCQLWKVENGQIFTGSEV
jgi:DNA replication and repair protein RecF